MVDWRAMATIVFRHADGTTERFEAREGETVMDCAFDNQVSGIVAQCGGGCTCATCHCYIDPPWFEQLAAPIPDELEMLEYVWERRANSRLSCQVFITEALDGMVVEIPAQQA